MHTDDLKIKTTNSRSYIEFYFNGKRVREYTGKSILLDLEPNRAKTQQRKHELLIELKLALLRHINEGNYPAKPKEQKPVEVVHTVQDALRLALDAKLRMKLSDKYKADLELIYNQFIEFLTPARLNMSYTAITVKILEDFLTQFNSSGTYYMRKRNDLCILFSLGGRLTNHKSIARETHTERTKATLHKAYDKQQLRSLLKHLQIKSSQLHLCCLLTYACWLRPHVEVLSLRKRQIKNECTEIHLSGAENKGGKVRVVYIPPYVKKHLAPYLEGLEQDANIFTGRKELLNEDYFTTRWKRLRPKLINEKLIEEGQTIYSFRHSAAIEIYMKTKDIYLLQRLMGHGSISVTQRYLRSLGQVDLQELKDAAPTL